MKLFLDSANLDELRQANALGVVDGLTTLTGHLAPDKADWKKAARQFCKEVDGPVFLETHGEAAADMLANARDLMKTAPNIVIKVPPTLEGLKTIRELHLQGMETDANPVFSLNQALLAAKAGATYVSIPVGRLDDMGQDGMQVIQDTMAVFRNYELQTQVIAAGVRNASHVFQAALAGADCSSLTWGTLRDLTKHPLNDVVDAKHQNDEEAR